MAGPGGTLHAPAVAEPVDRQPGDEDVPVVTGAIELGVEIDFGDWRVVAVEILDDEGDFGPMPAKQGEVEPVMGVRDAERQRATAGGSEGRWDGSLHSFDTCSFWCLLIGQAVSVPDGALRSFTRRIASSASQRIGLSSYAAAC
jgi:hypothetical protein